MATYGNLSLSELIVYNNSSSTSATLQLNSNVNPSDGNFAMSTGLDINGNLNVTGSTSINNNLTVNGTTNISGTTTISGNSININGSGCIIPFSGGGDVSLTFPTSQVGAPIPTPNPPSTSQAGLGIFWNASGGSGETDLIGYGQGSGGGISIFGMQTNVTDIANQPLNRITDFFSGYSKIYTDLDVSGNLTLANGNSYSVLSITPGSGASNTLLGVSTSLQIGSNTTEPNCYLQIQNGDVSGNLSINANDGNFAMTTGLDVSGNITLDGSLTISNSTSSGTLILNSSNIFNMNTGLVASGSISGSEFKIDGYVLGINNNNNFAINTGLSVIGEYNITLDGSLNLQGPNSGITFLDGSTLNSSSYIPFVNQSNTFTKKVILDASLNFSNNYGITFSDGSMLTSASGAGAGGASLSGTNNFTALNTFEAGLDISGTLIFTQDVSGSPQQYIGIKLNGTQAGGYLSFPYNTNGGSLQNPIDSEALTPYASFGEAAIAAGGTWGGPTGLGITWSYLGVGETDLIGYGGGNSGDGGITIYGYNTNDSNNTPTGDSATRIADFWPTGSKIYNNLSVVYPTTPTSGTAVMTSGIYNYYLDSTTLYNGGTACYILITLNSGSYGTITISLNNDPSTTDAWVVSFSYIVSPINNSLTEISLGTTGDASNYTIVYATGNSTTKAYLEIGALTGQGGLTPQPISFSSTTSVCYINAIGSSIQNITLPSTQP